MPVSHREVHSHRLIASVIYGRSHLDGSGGREFDRIIQEVEQHLAEPEGVTNQLVGHARADLECELQPFPFSISGQSGRSVPRHSRNEIPRDLTPGSPPRPWKVENVIEQGHQRLRGTFRIGQKFALLASQLGVQDQVRHT